MNDRVRKNGFVVFTRRAEYAAAKIAELLQLIGDEIEQVTIVTARQTDPRDVRIVSEWVATTHQNIYQVSFDDYAGVENIERMKSFKSGRLLLIVFDISQMLGNRLDFRLDQIQVRQRARAKIVVERFPYIARPWQFYFPYSLLDKTLLGYNHSYAIEGEYKKYKDGLRSNPLAVEIVGPQIRDVTFTDYELAFPRLPEIITQPVSSKQRQEYEEYRDRLFETEAGIAALLRKLDKFVQTLAPSRRIPFQLKEIYRPQFEYVVKTDLPLDDYLAKEMNETLAHSNELSAYLYRETKR